MHNGTIQHARIERLVSPAVGNRQTYESLFDIYRLSDYGQFHSTQPLRFADYHYRPRQAMLDDLGNDVHPLEHMPHTHDATVLPMLADQIKSDRGNDLSPEDITSVRLAAYLHDIGECSDPMLVNSCGTTVGDIPYRLKTTDDEKAESVIRKHVYTELFQSLSDAQLERIEAIVLQTDKADYATQFFRAAENVGYYKTGLRAGQLALNNFKEYQTNGYQDDERLFQLGRMGVIVPNHWRGILEEQAMEYPYIARLMRATRTDHWNINKLLLRHLVVV